ncbi:hypothetical protein BH11BAC7_BH11BAC7_26230 [soil metagenome]
MPNLPLARTLEEAIEARDHNTHLIGNVYPARESTVLKVADIIAVPFPLERDGENIDELFENNREFLIHNKNQFDPKITWNVFAVCLNKSQENICILLESILSGGVINY